MTEYRDISEVELLKKLGFGDTSLLPELVKEKIKFKHSYRVLNGQERDKVILSVMSSLNANKFRVSGENDNSVWEKGWGEVLSFVKTDTQFSRNSLVPQYFNKESVLRLFGEYVMSDVPNFSYDIDQAIRCSVFSTYLTGHKRIVEIGSGTGNSQYLLAQICPATTELVGSDWSTKSQDLINEISTHLKRPIEAVNFNMLTMAGYQDLGIDNETAVFTVHTLEQLGKSYNPLLERFIASKPAVCVHLEPIKELYDNESLLDHLAIKYHEIRNYLDGWLTELRALESQNKVKIIEQKKIQFGNKYHEAYNLIVWKAV